VAASNDGSLCVVEDTSEIEAFMRRDAGLHVYEIGDLDPFFRPRTRWFGWRGEALEALCLLYTGSETPTLVALGRPDEAPCIARLLHALERHLPPRVYAHLSPGLDECFVTGWTAQPHGRHLKMHLTDRRVVGAVDVTGVTAVAAADAEALTAFYDEHYPEHWFDPRMLESGQYRAVRANGRWLAAAGVHVYSAAYRVAALGNVVTARDLRGRGLGRAVTAAVCASLLGSVDVIGLNVLADNAPARTCYERLGFGSVAEYDEMLLERR
jgi:ribosomal protein S18 acetylase RimI-like enzyme